MGKIDEIIEEFRDLDRSERLELLLEFSESLPELPASYHAERDAGLHRVPECMSPTFLWVQCAGGRLQIHAYVAPEAPTVRGFVSILVSVFDGLRPEEITAVPTDLLQRLGLAELLGMNRLHGLTAVQRRLRNEIEKAAAKSIEC